MDIDRTSGTFGWLTRLFPGDESPGYKIDRSDAAFCLWKRMKITKKAYRTGSILVVSAGTLSGSIRS